MNGTEDAKFPQTKTNGFLADKFCTTRLDTRMRESKKMLSGVFLLRANLILFCASFPLIFCRKKLNKSLGV